jgi:hypothetical protein
VVPPFIGVAVKVTLPPAQTEVELAVMDTEGVTEFVVIPIAFDVAVEVVVQLALDVMITVTWSPFARELLVKVEALEPALSPFICH